MGANLSGKAVIAGIGSGPVLGRASMGYDAARLVYNERFDAVRPLAVVRPSKVADVQATVRWARCPRFRRLRRRARRC